MFVIDMVKPLIPSLHPPRLQLDNRLAEATPEAALAISSYAGFFALLANEVVILNVVLLSDMGLEGIPTVEKPSTLMYFARRFEFVAPPGLKPLIMLRMFVPFPVIFTTKCLEAIGMSATPRTCVALLVFSGTHVSIHEI